MSMFDSMMRQGGAPTLMAGLGESEAVIYRPPNGLAEVKYDAILGAISIGEELEQIQGASGKNAVEKRTAKVIPRESATEIVDTGLVVISGVNWSIARITHATPTMITMELQREVIREHPRARRR
jgi:hypothetical protein